MLLMEKSRAGRRSANDQTFHVLSRLVIGAEGHLQKELHLDHSTTEIYNPFVSISQKLEEKQKASAEFHRLVQAFDALNVEPSSVKALWAVLASIVHLGVAGVAKGNGNRSHLKCISIINCFLIFQLVPAPIHACSSQIQRQHKRLQTCWASAWKR